MSYQVITDSCANEGFTQPSEYTDLGFPVPGFVYRECDGQHIVNVSFTNADTATFTHQTSQDELRSLLQSFHWHDYAFFDAIQQQAAAYLEACRQTQTCGE